MKTVIRPSSDLRNHYSESELELLRTLAEAEDDVKNNRVAPIHETFDSIRQELMQRNT